MISDFSFGLLTVSPCDMSLPVITVAVIQFKQGQKIDQLYVLPGPPETTVRPISIGKKQDSDIVPYIFMPIPSQSLKFKL